MAKKKPQPPTAALAVEETAESEASRRRQIDLDDDTRRKAGAAANLLGITPTTYINNRLRAVVDEELPRLLRALGLPLSDSNCTGGGQSGE